MPPKRRSTANKNYVPTAKGLKAVAAPGRRPATRSRTKTAESQMSDAEAFYHIMQLARTSRRKQAYPQRAKLS